MAAARNMYAQYRNSEVLTATPGELVLKLYEGTIRFCNQAKDAIDRGDVQGAHTNLLKAQRIIDHLLATLDRSYEVSKDFDNIYQYLLDALMIVNVNKDRELLESVIANLRLVRDNWKEVIATANQ